MLAAVLPLVLAAGPAPAAADAARELASARAQAQQARAERAAPDGAWLAALRAAERALRLASPAWAEAVDRGDDAGAAAARVGPGGAEPLYWLALSTMALARGRGFAAVLAAGPTARASLERAAALDPGIDCAGPDRELGAWLAALPSAAGGGAALARRAFERARARGPTCLATPVAEAGTLAVLLQDRARFDRLLSEVLAFDLSRDEVHRGENARAQDRARALQAERDRLF